MRLLSKITQLRPRFSLVSFLVFVTVFAPIFGLIGQKRLWNARRIYAYQRFGAHFGSSMSLHWDAREPDQERWWDRTKALVWLEGKTPKITRISLSGGNGTIGAFPPLLDDEVNLLAYFPELEEVVITQAEKVTDESLSVLGRLRNLKAIRLESLANVEGKFLKSLKDSNNLTQLWLEKMPKLRGDELEPIGSFDNLYFFKLSQCPTIREREVRAVSLPKSVISLSLTEVEIGDQALSQWLAQCQLVTLVLDVRFSRNTAMPLASQRQLITLSIVDAPLTDEDLQFLGACPRLRSLKLDRLPIRGRFLRLIADWKMRCHVDLTTSLKDADSVSELRNYVAPDGLSGRPPWAKSK